MSRSDFNLKHLTVNFNPLKKNEFKKKKKNSYNTKLILEV